MPKEKARDDGLSRIGSRSWTRTNDPLINSQLLYRLSYPGMEASPMFSAKLSRVLLLRETPFRTSIERGGCVVRFSTVILWALAPLAALALVAATEVRDVPSGKMAIVRPASTPLGSVILVPGGSTQISISESGQPSNGGNFVLRARRHFVEAGYAIAYVEDPSNLAAPIAAMRAIARPVVLVATSNGTIAAVDNALALDKDGPDAVVLTSTVTVPNTRFTHAVTASQIARLKMPVLFVHNTNDRCKVSRPSDARSVADADKSATFIEVTTDEVPSEDQCGPYAPHGYKGGEPAVIQQIVDWVAAHASARRDS